MKHTRETMSPTSVTLGLVEDGEIIGTPWSWATFPPAIESDDATSPMSPTTWSCCIRRVTAVTASC